MQILADEKAALRRAAGRTRQGAHSAAPGAGEALRDHVLAANLVPPGAIVSGYCPMRSETDPIPLMTALSVAGHRVCAPVIEAKAAPLRFREWKPGAALEEGPFGASVPAEGDWLEPGMLLVPLLAFDRQGYRLGYGGGFYDRTLARLRANGPLVACGVAYAAQEVAGVPVDPTDEGLDAIATEAGVLRIPATR